MGTSAEVRARPPLGSERPPWTVVLAAILCSATVVVSVAASGYQLWEFREGRRESPFFAVPGGLFTESSWVVPAAFLLVVAPWAIAVIAASVRMLFPHRAAHVSVVGLLCPALALDLVGYVAVLFSGQPLSAAHVPYGLWFVLGVVIFLLLAPKRARQFEARLYPTRGKPWSEELWDDGT